MRLTETKKRSMHPRSSSSFSSSSSSSSSSSPPLIPKEGLLLLCVIGILIISCVSFLVLLHHDLLPASLTVVEEEENKIKVITRPVLIGDRKEEEVFLVDEKKKTIKKMELDDVVEDEYGNMIYTRSPVERALLERGVRKKGGAGGGGRSMVPNVANVSFPTELVCHDLKEMNAITQLCYRQSFNVVNENQFCQRKKSFRRDFHPCPAELLTQMSVDRLDLLLRLIKDWTGFISAVIYTENIQDDYQRVIKSLESECGCDCKFEGRVRIHFVVGWENAPYPINVMRNIAFENGALDRVDLVMMHDIDFILSPDMCERVRFWQYNLSSTSPGILLPWEKTPKDSFESFSSAPREEWTRKLKENNVEMPLGREMLYVLPAFKLTKGEQYLPPKDQPGRGKIKQHLNYLEEEEGESQEESQLKQLDQAQQPQQQQRQVDPENAPYNYRIITKDRKLKIKSVRNFLPNRVVDSFSSSFSSSFTFPREKEEVVELVERGDVVGFDESFDGQFHDQRMWANLNVAHLHTDVRLYNEFYAFFSRSEFLKRKIDGLPLCDPSFFDRGFNKIICFLHLRMTNLLPVVLPNVWLFHIPEPAKWKQGMRHCGEKVGQGGIVMPKSELEGRGEERARRIDRYCNYDIFLDSFCSLGNQYMQIPTTREEKEIRDREREAGPRGTCDVCLGRGRGEEIGIGRETKVKAKLCYAHEANKLFKGKIWSLVPNKTDIKILVMGGLGGGGGGGGVGLGGRRGRRRR